MAHGTSTNNLKSAVIDFIAGSLGNNYTNCLLLYI